MREDKQSDPSVFNEKFWENLKKITIFLCPKNEVILFLFHKKKNDCPLSCKSKMVVPSSKSTMIGL